MNKEIYNTSIKIKNLTLKNRFVMAPIYIGKEIHEEEYQKFYIERAKGNVGLIIAPIPTNNGLSDIEKPHYINSYKKLIENCEKYDSHIILQVFSGDANKVNEYTQSELQSIPDKFSRASRILKDSGFKGIEIHGAHHSLFMELLSPIKNMRNDMFNGTLDNKMSLQLKTVEAIKKETGNDFLIFYRFSASDLAKNGVDIAQTSIFASELEKVGADVIDVSVGGTTVSPKYSECPDENATEGCFSNYSKEIKNCVNIPVICAGKINSLNITKEILLNESADLIAIGRNLVADSNFIVNLLESNNIDKDKLQNWYKYLPK